MRIVLLSLLFAVLLVALLVSGLYVYARGHGFSARQEPSLMERTMARNARKVATPADAKNLKNPREQQTAEMIAEADEHFIAHCSVCHGIDGRGDTTIGRNLYPKAPDMTTADTQQLADGELFYIINNGIRLTGMPAWGSEDKPEAIWDLVALIRRLPKLSPEEKKRLESLANPPDETSKEETENKKPGEQAKPPHKHTHQH